MGDSYRFGDFEVQGRAGQLLYKGMRVRIQDLPFRMLLVLLENPGEVVSREELRNRLWGDKTFVEFDKNLRVAAAKLREALNDNATEPRFLETVAKRGYRFLGEVTPVGPSAPPLGPTPGTATPVFPVPGQTVAPPQPLPPVQIVTRVSIAGGPPVALGETLSSGLPPARKRRRPVLAASGVAALLIVVVGVWFFVRHQRQRLSASTGSVAVGSVRNDTGDANFDEALTLPFRIKMEESPSLHVLPSEVFTRAAMKTPGDGREMQACQALGAHLLLGAHLRRATSGYSIEVTAQDCGTGKQVASTSAHADSENRLLDALGSASEQMRLRLGETASSLQRFDVPLTQATTTSLAALRAFREGEQRHLNGQDLESKSYYKLAIDLDPQFAVAYLQLGRGFSNSGETALSRQYYEKAFALRDRTTDREKLYIASSYYSYATGETERAINAYELWLSLYPRDVVPANNLATQYILTGQSEKAVASARRAIEVDPMLGAPYATLAQALLVNGDYATLKVLCDDKTRAKTLSLTHHMACYDAAFVTSDPARMQREVDWANSAGVEAAAIPVMLNEQAEVAMYGGRIAEAHRLFTASIAAAHGRDMPEFATLIDLNRAADDEETGEPGNAAVLAQQEIGRGSRGNEIGISAALLLALTGNAEKARALAASAAQESPNDTLLNSVELPTVEAVIAIKQGRPADALRVLEIARPYELCNSLELMPVYYRGLAYLGLNQPAQARAEFMRLVAHRSNAAHSIYVPLAQLQIARIAKAQGDNVAAASMEATLRETWKNADPGFRPLRQLEAENLAR